MVSPWMTAGQWAELTRVWELEVLGNENSRVFIAGADSIILLYCV